MNLKSIFTLSVLSLLLTGCINKPEDAVRNVFDAIKEGDLPKLSRNTNDVAAGAFSVHALKNCSVDKESYEDDMLLVNDCLFEEYSKIDVKNIEITNKSENVADASVTILNKDNKIVNYQLKVFKVDYRWKVHFQGEEE